MEISHLVVAGCSWTYCQGLHDPKVQGWPALVAKELNVPVVNLAKPGLGNDAIHRRTYEYAFEDLPNNNNPFYIVCWTQTWRREAWCRKIYNSNEPDGYHIVAMPHAKPENDLERVVLDTWNEEDFYRKLNIHRLSLDSLFKAHNINYFTSFFADEYNNEYRHLVEDVETRFSNIRNHLIDNTNRIDDFHRIADPYPKTRCGHEGIEGNRVIAEYVLKTIKERYNIVTTNKPFLSLKEYEQKTDPHGKFISNWL